VFVVGECLDVVVVLEYVVGWCVVVLVLFVMYDFGEVVFFGDCVGVIDVGCVV